MIFVIFVLKFNTMSKKENNSTPKQQSSNNNNKKPSLPVNPVKRSNTGDVYVGLSRQGAESTKGLRTSGRPKKDGN